MSQFDAFNRTRAGATLDDAERVSAAFWDKLRAVVGRIPFVQDLLAVYYCALDPATPMRVRGTLLAALAYFILPVDAIPDLLPALGFTDDAAVIAAAIGMVSGHVKPAHRAAAARALDTPPAGHGSV